MKTPLMPAELDISLIGMPVVIQTIPRERPGDDGLNVAKMEKYVGTLEAYRTAPNFFAFKLEGLTEMYFPPNNYVLEIYIDATWANKFGGN